jgi:hypothetical protein
VREQRVPARPADVVAAVVVEVGIEPQREPVRLGVEREQRTRISTVARAGSVT